MAFTFKNQHILEGRSTCQNLLVEYVGNVYYILDMDIYKLKIKKYRKLKGMTQKELANRLGISQNYLSEIERGAYDIKVSLLLKIAAALDLEHPGDLIECYFNYNYYI